MKNLREEIRGNQWNQAWIICLSVEEDRRHDYLYLIRTPIVQRVWNGPYRVLIEYFYA